MAFEKALKCTSGRLHASTVGQVYTERKNIPPVESINQQAAPELACHTQLK